MRKKVKKANTNLKKISKSHKKYREWYPFTLRNFIDGINLMTPIQKSVIITFFLMVSIVLSANFIRLVKNEKEIMLEMNFLAEATENDTPTLENAENQDVIPSEKISIQAYNEADKTLAHSEEPFKSLDEILAERDMKAAKDEFLTDKINDENIVLKPNKGADNQVVSSENKDLVNKNALVKYALTDRVIYGELPNPVFTCEEAGKVVVIIKVNEEGRVIHCSIDYANSSTSNGCLIENALKYAQQARFNVDISKRVQKGTITYLFQQK